MSELDDILRILVSIDERLTALEGGSDEVEEPTVEPPMYSGFLSWTAELHDALPDGNCDTSVFLNALGEQIGELGAAFPEIKNMLIGVGEDMQEISAAGGSLPWKAMVAQVGKNLEKEGQEPGEFAPITRAEFLDAWWTMVNGNAGVFIRGFGRQPYLPFISFIQVLGRTAMVMGESLGAGEKIPMGGGDDTPPEGGWPWSMGGH